MKMIKKISAILMIVVMCLCAVGCASDTSEGGDKVSAKEKYGSDVLKLYNWGEYMGENLISNFEQEYGVKVIVELFDSNEMMYTKIQAGDKYDVLVPSDYMIERLISEDLIQPIDQTRIPNMSNLAEGVKNLSFDPDNKYSVPYFWGTVGIVYNHNNVALEDLEREGFDILKDERYKGRVYLYDSERDAFLIALKQLGYSCNTDNEAEIEEAYQWLLDANKNDPVYVTDEVIDFMMNGSKDMAIVYSGDAVTILEENPDMSYYTPMCGTNIWCDSMVIPKNAENPLLAHEFINYVLTYEASYDNSSTVGYASSNKDVLADLTAEGGDFQNNVAYLPRTYDKDETYHDNAVIRRKLSELLIKVKAD